MIKKEFSIKNMLNCFPQVEIEKYIYTLLDENKQLKEEINKLKEQIVEYQDEIFAINNNWYDMCD